MKFEYTEQTALMYIYTCCLLADNEYAAKITPFLHCKCSLSMLLNWSEGYSVHSAFQMMEKEETVL